MWNTHKTRCKWDKKALHEFADFDIESRNEIFKIQRTHFHRLKEIHKDCDNEILSQYALVIAIKEYIKSISPEKREIQKFMKKFTKQGKKERILLERWSRIRKAILEENVSFRQLAIFLNDYEMNPFNLEEIKLILDNASSWFKNFLGIAFFTGMRTGEIDVLSQCEIFLKNQQKISGLDKNLFNAERRDGKIYGSCTLKYPWEKLLKKCNLEYRNIYQTRHTLQAIC